MDPERKDIYLVRPVVYQERNSPFFMPLGLLCMGAVLREHGFRPHVVDYEFQNRIGALEIDSKNYLRQLCDPLVEAQAPLVGLTALSDTLPLALLMGQYLKRHSPKTVVTIGGPGLFGVLPHLMQRFPDAVDYMCKGEGEIAMLSLVEALARGEERPRVPGMYLQTPDGPVDCGDAPWANLNALPPPAYDLVDVPGYFRIASPRIFDLYVGSGCTYACTFCTTAPFWGRNFRVKSPERIFQELETLHAHYGITQVNFLHDNFANKRDYLDGFLDYFEKHNTRYEWACAVRPDNLTPDRIHRMRKAGCFNLFSGTESGSAKILRQMLKLPDSKKSYGLFEACANAGVQLETNTIIGYPDEADGDLEESLALVFDSVSWGAAASDVTILSPLPGAPVTKKHLGDVVFEPDQLVAFFPPEVLQMAKENIDLFSSFGFIRRGNREYSFYTRLLKTIRYFTRHHFLTVFTLKELCETRYLDVFRYCFERSTDPLQSSKLLFQFISEELKHPLAGLARSVFLYEDTLEQLKANDIQAELTNCYLPATVLGSSKVHAVVDVAHPVHQLFHQMPELKAEGVTEERTSYLFYVDQEHAQIEVARLAPWQRELWDTVRSVAEAGESPVDLETAAVRFSSPSVAATQVETTARTFARVLSSKVVARPAMPSLTHGQFC